MKQNLLTNERFYLTLVTIAAVILFVVSLTVETKALPPEASLFFPGIALFCLGELLNGRGGAATRKTTAGCLFNLIGFLLIVSGAWLMFFPSRPIEKPPEESVSCLLFREGTSGVT